MFRKHWRILAMWVCCSCAILAVCGCELEDEERTPQDFGVLVAVMDGMTPVPDVMVSFSAKKAGSESVLRGSCVTGGNGKCCWAFGFNLSSSDAFHVTATARYAMADYSETAQSRAFHRPDSGSIWEQYANECGLAYLGRSMSVLAISVSK